MEQIQLAVFNAIQYHEYSLIEKHYELGTTQKQKQWAEEFISIAMGVSFATSYSKESLFNSIENFILMISKLNHYHFCKAMYSYKVALAQNYSGFIYYSTNSNKYHMTLSMVEHFISSSKNLSLEMQESCLRIISEPFLNNPSENFKTKREIIPAETIKNSLVQSF